MSIKNVSDYTRLAEVSYVDFSQIKDLKNNIDDLIVQNLIAKKDDVEERSEGALKQFAKLVVDNYQILAHWKDSNSLFDGESGFSGTLFQAKDTGGFVLALKGTAGFKDLVVTDVTDIIPDGLAHHQIVDMYNFWQQINTPEGQSYQAAAIKTVAIDPLGAISLLEGTTAEGYFSNNVIIK